MLSGYDLAMSMRDAITQIVTGKIDELRPKPRYGTVTAFNFLSNVAQVRYNGDTNSVPVNAGSILPKVGSIVRIEGTIFDRYIADVVGQSYTTYAQRVQWFTSNASRVIMGGGLRKSMLDLYVAWAQDFLVAGAGYGLDASGDGFHRIQMPVAGTTLTGMFGAPSSVVPSSGLYTGMIPLPNWSVLWYDLPINVAGNSAYNPLNWKITTIQRGQNFQIPDTWVPIVMRNGEGPANTVRWCDGRVHSDWKTLTMTNGWTAFGSIYAPPQYRFENGRVYLRGLMKGGASQSIPFTLPVGFRPEYRMIFHGSGSASVEPPNNNANYEKYLRMDMATDGGFLFGGVDSTYVSLDGISWDAFQ